MSEMLVMVRQTYEAGEPAMIALRGGSDDAALIAFVEQLANAIKEKSAGGYERTAVTVEIWQAEIGQWVKKLAVEM